MAKTKVRKSLPSVALTKAEFTGRVRERFVDPAFAARGVMIVTPVNWYQARCK
jgi:hypothetical protein